MSGTNKIPGRVYCQDCAYAAPAREPHWWLCKAAPAPSTYRFVTHDFIHERAPFLRCETVNPIGNCPMWEERKTNAD